VKFNIGETVRVTRGDLRGRTGIVRRVPGGTHRGQATYGVEFSGESGMSSFRETNLEAARIGAGVPEYMIADGSIHLLADEPYELITGGLMGKRRRYTQNGHSTEPPFGMADDDTDTCDFRRFPVEHEGVVIAGLWSRFSPDASHVAEVIQLVELAR
jgi:hypothetical protein